MSRLGSCEVCNKNDAKYTCPKCEVKTCCLECSKIHKYELNCDGKNDQIKYLPIKSLSHTDLFHDFKLLEEVGRVIETSKRQPNSKIRHLPKFLHNLRFQANKRKLKLRLLPYGFVKRMTNSTRYNIEKKIIEWRIDWIFVNADSLVLTDEKVNENTRTARLLAKYLVGKQEDEAIEDQLKYYKSAGFEGVRLFLVNEDRDKRQMVELDMCDSIKENLENKSIVEYPTIHVVLKDHSIGYSDIIYDNVSDNTSLLYGNRVISELIEEEENTGDKSSKNLLFSNG